jgi:hypothetical protein
MELSDEQIRALVDHWAARLELAEIAGELTADEVRAQAEIAMAWAREKLGGQPGSAVKIRPQLLASYSLLPPQLAGSDRGQLSPVSSISAP